MHQLNYGFRRVITAGQLMLTPTSGHIFHLSWRDEDEQSGCVLADGTDVGNGRYLRDADSLPKLNASVYSFVAKLQKE